MYSPDSSARAVVIINSAIAVTARLYQHFAKFLCENNYIVITYDYRGMGNSRLSHKGETDLITWTRKDFAGIIEFVRTSFQGMHLLLIGHSFGGQLPRLCPQIRYVKGMLAICAQCGYWRLWPLPHRWALFFLWYLFMPITTKFLGFFPAKIIGLGENLPAGAA